MHYITIDGDDVGRKITACYINNDEVGLQRISDDLALAVARIEGLLIEHGFRIIFSAADGVAGVGEVKDSVELQAKIRCVSPPGHTFSSGIGTSLREAYIALEASKCAGKNTMTKYVDSAMVASRSDKTGQA